MKAKKGGKRKMEQKHDLTVTSETWRRWHMITLQGKFVVQSIALVRKKLDEIEAEESPRIALDMSGVTQIDSSSLTVLLNLQKRLKRKDGLAVVIGPADEVKETLYLVGFNMAVPIYSSRTVFEQSFSAN
jgi:anti-anti-sigma factor